MRLWTLPFRLFGILALAALVAGGWLFRRELQDLAGAVTRPPSADAGLAGGAADETLARARDKVDSLHGWAADSVVLSAPEMAALILDGLPPEAARHLDSLRLTLGEGRVTIGALLETTQIPPAALGPLAGALEPWEPVTAAGAVVVTGPGRAEWRVDRLALRGFNLPESASRELVARALPGAKRGAVPIQLPRGIAGLRVRPTGVALFREETR